MWNLTTGRGFRAFYASIFADRNLNVAMDAMRRVLEKSPGHPEALAFRAEGLLARGHYREASKDAKQYYAVGSRL